MNNEEENPFEGLAEVFEKFFAPEKYKKTDIEVYPDKMCILETTKNKMKTGIKKKIFFYRLEYDKNKYKNISEILEVEIPPNSKQNDTIIYKGLGNKTKGNEQIGDLYVKIALYGKECKKKGNMIKIVNETKRILQLDEMTRENVEVIVENEKLN